MYDEAFKNLLKSCLSFGGGLNGSNEEKIEATEEKSSILKCGEYIYVNIWCMLDWILSQNWRNTLHLDTVDQLVRSAKNETLLYLSEPPIRQTEWTL